MEGKPNLKLFDDREEISELIDSNTGQYINLRISKDTNLLEDILTQLRNKGPDFVLASWISPPFGIIKGYGIYSKEEAYHLAERSKKEKWGFPCFGSIYDQERLENHA